MASDLTIEQYKLPLAIQANQVSGFAAKNPLLDPQRNNSTNHSEVPRMRKQAAQTWRAATAVAAAGLLVAALLACSGPNSQQPESLPTLIPAPTSTPRAGEAAPTDISPTITSAPVPVASEQDSSEGQVARPVATSPPPTARATGVPGMEDMIAEQLVAAFENVLYGIYEETLPSVVYIRVANPAGARFQGIPNVPDELIWSAGSGFVWDDEGHIVTNHHVVASVVGVTDEVIVVFPDSTQATATVIGGDPHSDLAVLKLDNGNLKPKPVTLGDSSDVRVGQLTVAIGAPFGQEFTMTSGIVSAVGRDIRGEAQFTIPEVIQTDSAINPGNSGGPLLDSQARVIGINTQIISRTGNFSGVGMAVPVNIAKRVVPPLIESGEFDYPWLGVNIAGLNSAYAEALDLPADTRGALIVRIVEGSPADRAGLRPSEDSVEVDGVDYPAGGDVVVAIGSDVIQGTTELIAHLSYDNRPGDTVTFTVLRDGERREIEVTLGQRPTPR